MKVEEALILESFELIKEAELIQRGESVKNKQRIAQEIRDAKKLLMWHKHFIHYFPEYFDDDEFLEWKETKATIQK